MGWRLNLDGGTLNLDGGKLNFDGGTRPSRPPYNLRTGYICDQFFLYYLRKLYTEWECISGTCKHYKGKKFEFSGEENETNWIHLSVYLCSDSVLYWTSVPCVLLGVHFSAQQQFLKRALTWWSLRKSRHVRKHCTITWPFSQAAYHENYNSGSLWN